MNVTVNGKERAVEPDATVDGLVELATSEGVHRGVAVALNGEVVPRSRWSETRLTDGDKIELLNAIGGG